MNKVTTQSVQRAPHEQISQEADELLLSLNEARPWASHEVVSVFNRVLRLAEDAGQDEQTLQQLIYDVRLWFTTPQPVLSRQSEEKMLPLTERFYRITDNEEFLPPSVASHFAERFGAFHNPLLRARYADFLATLATPQDTPSQREWVQRAVIAYLEAVPITRDSPEVSHQIEAVESLDSAGHLALCKAHDLLPDVVRALRDYLEFALAQSQHEDGAEVRFGRWAVDAGWILLSLREKAPAQVNDELLNWWGNQAVALARSNAGLDDFFLEQSFWSQSAEAALLRGDNSARFSYLREFALSKVREARARTQGPGASFLAAASLMESAVDFFDRLRSHDVLSPEQRAELLREIGALKLEIREFYKTGEREMGVVSVPFDLPEEKIADVLRELLKSPSLHECLKRVGANFLPDVQQAEQWAETRTNDGSISSLFGVSFMGDGMNLGSYSSQEDKKQVERNRMMDRQIHINSGLFLPRIFQVLRAEKNLSAETFLAYLDATSLMEEQNRPLIEQGLKHYFAEEFASALHLLVPQLEALVRQLVERAGLSPVKLADREHNGWQFESFGALLHRVDKELPGFMPPELRFYVERTLCERTGWNLRNRIAHGMITLQECNRFTTETVLHLYLSFALFEELAKLEKPHEPSANFN